MTRNQTPLRRARGLGSAKSGIHHWRALHFSSVALVPLVIWLVFSLIDVLGGDYAAAQAFVSSPLVAVLLVLTFIFLFYHSALGVQVIIEDYVPNHTAQYFAILGANLVMVFACGAAVISVILIATG